MNGIGTCGECRYAVLVKGPDGKIDFTKKFCKYDPPKVIPLPAPGGVALQSVMPVVEASETGCHNFTPKLVS